MELARKLVGAVAKKPFERSAQEAQRLVENQFGDALSAEELRMLCKVGEQSCSFHEYVLAMMIKLGKISQDDIDSCASNFQRLDKDGDGILTVRDLSEREREDYDIGHGVRETRSTASIPVEALVVASQSKRGGNQGAIGAAPTVDGPRP